MPDCGYIKAADKNTKLILSMGILIIQMFVQKLSLIQLTEMTSSFLY